MPTVAPPPASRRIRRDLGHRPAGFLECSPAQERDIAAVLEVVGSVQRLYLVGRRPGGVQGGGTDGLRRWAAGTLPPGWFESPRGHYLEGEHPILRYHGPHGLLEVGRAAAWYGEGSYTAADALDAWRLLGAELDRDFPGCQLLGSPAATGRELFQRVIPFGKTWPTLARDHQDLVRAHAGQGRIELLDRAAPTVPALHVYDGRLFYAALCWGLPAGPAEHVRCDEYLGQRRARYLAQVTVPFDWDTACVCGAPGHPGIGVLPWWDDSDHHWRYPSEQRRSFTGWWDGAELWAAVAHGWDVRPSEALLFQEYAGAGPLDGWSHRLIACRQRLARFEQGPASVLAQRAIRNVILHAIGAFTGRTHRVTRSLPIDQADEVPAAARDLRVEADRIVWAEYQEATQPGLSHPEWSAAIWARARARLLDGPGVPEDRRRTGALKVPAGDVLAFRTDALYLTRDPGWRDDGHAGRLRLTRSIAGPSPTPRTAAELLAMTP